MSERGGRKVYPQFPAHITPVIQEPWLPLTTSETEAFEGRADKAISEMLEKAPNGGEGGTFSYEETSPYEHKCRTLIRGGRSDCCDYCGCLLPEDYRPTCSQGGAPIRGRQAEPRSGKWAEREERPFSKWPTFVGKDGGVASVEQELNRLSRTSKGV